MIRLIIRKSTFPPGVPSEVFTMKTIDIEAPELEELLNTHEFADDGFTTCSIDGYEIIKNKEVDRPADLSVYRRALDSLHNLPGSGGGTKKGP